MSQQVIVGMHFLCNNYLNLDLTPDHAHLIHTPTQQYQVLVAQMTEPGPPLPDQEMKRKWWGGGGNKHSFKVHPLK